MDEVFEAEVRRRIDDFGMSREQAELLVAALMWNGPTSYDALKEVESEMNAGFGSSFGETRERVRRAIKKVERDSRG